MPNCVHGIDSRFCATCAGNSPDRRREAIKLRAAQHAAPTDAEREALEAIYAYEEALAETKGKKLRASRTWQMIERHGIIPAVERIVKRAMETAGYRTLIEMGLEEMAFEAVVLRHPNSFSPEAVAASKQRLDVLKKSSV
jgi:hypothetical protein